MIYRNSYSGVIRRFKRKRFIVYISYVLFLSGIFTLIIGKPNHFQKWNSIIAKDYDNQNLQDLTLGTDVLEVSSFIGSIPYQPHPSFIYEVLPSKKYRRTIIQGDGVCSQLVFGAAYHLLQQGISFEVIGFLPPSTFLKGGGHVALRVGYQLNGHKQIGIVDLAEGGIPQSNGKLLDVKDIEHGAAPNFSILSLNFRKNNSSTYYGKYLDNTYIGRTPDNEVKQYFEFIEAVYIPLGNEKIEKYLYDGLSIILDRYYHIYVSPGFFKGHEFERCAFISILWLIRITIILFPIIILFEIVHAKRSKIHHPANG